MLNKLSPPHLRTLRPISRSLFTIVHQGEQAYRTKLGKNPVKLLPGLHANIPLLHKVQTVDMREGSIQIQGLHGFTSDNVPVLLSGSLFYTIKDSYSACFQVQNVKASVENVGTSAMRSVMGNFPYDKVISDRNTINERLRTVIGKSIDQWGVECTRFEIQSFSPSNKNVEKQLELQMEAERNRRKQLLDTEAKVNISEGLKRSSILKSEGELITMANQAEGNYKLKLRNAEAEKAKVDLETHALCNQIFAIADVLGGDRVKAFEGILFLRQLEQMKAIAKGANNSTYFFGDKSITGDRKTSLMMDQNEVLKKALVVASK